MSLPAAAQHAFALLAVFLLPLSSELALGEETSRYINLRDIERQSDQLYGRPLAPVNQDTILKAYITQYNLAASPSDYLARSYALHFADAYTGLNPDVSAATLLSLMQQTESAYQFQWGARRGERFQLNWTAIVETAKLVPGAREGKPESLATAARIAHEASERNNATLNDRWILEQAQNRYGLPAGEFERYYRQTDHVGGLYNIFRNAGDRRAQKEALDQYLSKAVNGVSLDSDLRAWRQANRTASDSAELKELQHLVRENRYTLLDIRRLLDRSLASTRPRPSSTTQTPAPSTTSAPTTPLTQQERDERASRVNLQFAAPRALHSLLESVLPPTPENRAVFALNRFALDVAQTQQMFQAGLISSVVQSNLLYGYGIGAVFALGQILFGQSDAFAAIFKELQELRKQIDALHRDMLANFATLREMILELYYRVDLRLDLLERGIRQDLHDLKHLTYATLDGVSRTEEHVVDLKHHLLDGLKELRASEIENAKNSCLNVPPTELERDRAFQALTRLYTCATHDSLSASEGGSGSSDTPLAEANTNQFWLRLDDLLKNGSPWERLRPLGDAAVRFEARSLSPRVPAPLLWGICADYYLRCARARPDLYRRYDPTQRHLIELRAVGERFQLAASRLLSAAPGSKDKAGWPLFRDLVDAYRSEIDALETTLQLVRRRAERPEGPTKSYDLLAGIGLTAEEKQIHTWSKIAIPAEITPRITRNQMLGDRIHACTPRNTHPYVAGYDVVNENPQAGETGLEWPARIETLLPDYVLVAHDLGLGKLVVCYDAAGYTLGSDFFVRIRATFDNRLLFARELQFHFDAKRVMEWDRGTPIVRMHLVQPVFRELWNNTWRDRFVERAFESRTLVGFNEYLYPDAEGEGRNHVGYTGGRPPSASPRVARYLRENADNVREVRTRLRQHFETQRMRIDGDVRAELALPSSVPGQALRRVNAAKRLLYGLLEISLPRTLAANRALRQVLTDPLTRLFGAAEIRATMEVENIYRLPATRIPALDRPRERIAAIETALQAALTRLTRADTNPTVDERIKEIEEFRLRQLGRR